MEEKYMSFEEHKKEIKDIKRKRSLKLCALLLILGIILYFI